MTDLAGLNVVSLEHAVAAPYASMKLADAGARVIKVERPEGDFARGYDNLAKGGSAYFVWLNRGKESVALDLKDEADRALLDAMIAKADVFIQNMGPGVIERLGFAPERLRARDPRLIICSISGYGSEGPRARQKAYDLLIQAESGLAAINGTPEGPARVGVSVCDIAAGMTAYQAILEALIGRGISGKGRHIEVSLYHAMADWMNVPYIQHHYGGKTPGRQGLKHPTIAPYGAFECADGRALLLSVQNDREWAQLCSAFDAPEAATDGRFRTNNDRVANRAETDALVASWLARGDREANIALLEEARIAVGRLSDLQDVVEHPQNRFVEVETPQGTLRLLAPGAIDRDGAARHYGPVPELDQHGRAIRAEFAEARVAAES
ncbi:crotonobetainyl-CoA:carnitine CoA-transferase CaiB-like acyl-CoA transferase [Limimaricola variabilis]|uniref:Crotonobetainyl-CoA:carnitine CoA-transferase CaiB-like acyl-CoA transferase n=1 Tax=Limimaricola variabilis TaxID=1492771 RepID=A0ABR6HJ61_9RHOB|nr:CaiB/BaiF CoA-transferase family protein [Limimaricola variabilis]MBB3710517.1 crotonobetainyl-CoA:carnitine CoA-transferase CaiB-like acyl-CoA transferase [Limimaricola variabilis]